MDQTQRSRDGRSRLGAFGHIAVVDDEIIVCRALERLLRASGFRVSTFTSAEAFLADFARDRPDCLVLDLYLGRMSGVDVLEALSAMGERIPVIVITAHDHPLTRERCLQTGAAACLSKPFDDWQLRNAIRQALSDVPLEEHEGERDLPSFEDVAL